MKRIRASSVVKIVLAVTLLGIGLWLLERQAHPGVYIDRSVAFFREAGPLPFFIAMTCLPIIGFPLSPFTVVAGPVFGPVMGVGMVILCSIVAVTINVAISYWVASRALRPLISRLIKRLGYELPVIEPGTAWTIILLVRIVPGPPFPLQSYVLGLARAPFGPYMLVSTVVPAAYLVAMILFGDALMRGDRSAMIGAGVFFLVAGAVLHQLRRRFKARKLQVKTKPMV
ncbi:MAG: associated Golgi protein [Verrucomicrobia bacterium]|nr:associated Golgi protein [Verrucomicrobiota bacterium]